MIKMEKWEYKMGTVSADSPVGLIDKLNELGDEGWELVQYEEYISNMMCREYILSICIFKRRNKNG